MVASVIESCPGDEKENVALQNVRQKNHLNIYNVAFHLGRPGASNSIVLPKESRATTTKEETWPTVVIVRSGALYIRVTDRSMQ